jgi:signal transduction histidine kinase
MSQAIASEARTRVPADAEGASELADLLRAFNDVTAKLQGTQETLRSEVRRLQGELEQANAQLRRSRELAALGEMAAGIAHEIRNPLGSIKLYSEALAEDLAGQDEPRAMAAKIGSAVRGLDRIVGDVLAFSKEMRLRPQECEAAGLLHRAVEEAKRELLDAGAAVEIDAIDDLVVCDADLMQRALVNLVRNAAEAAGDSENKPIVRLSADRKWRRGTDGRRAACVSLAVEDSGPGIADEAVGRMFNPFFTTRAAGTGLGLAIVHRIVDAHGGAVEVSRGGDERDEPDALAGARVAVLLPVDPERSIEPNDTGGRGQSGSPEQAGSTR